MHYAINEAVRLMENSTRDGDVEMANELIRTILHGTHKWAELGLGKQVKFDATIRSQEDVPDFERMYTPEQQEKIGQLLDLLKASGYDVTGGSQYMGSLERVDE